MNAEKSHFLFMIFNILPFHEMNDEVQSLSLLCGGFARVDDDEDF